MSAMLGDENIGYKPVVEIQMISDVACPWCYIGLQRLSKAMEELKDEVTVNLTILPFVLDPRIPKEGLDAPTYFDKKFGSKEAKKQIFERVEAVGRQEGIRFSFGAIPKAINTLPLHKLLHAAREQGKDVWVKKRLFELYFEEKLDLSVVESLENGFADIGWSIEEVRRLWESQALEYKVMHEIQEAQKIGVTGVPFFKFNHTYAISGAQEVGTFVNAIRQIGQEVSQGASCDIGETC